MSGFKPPTLSKPFKLPTKDLSTSAPQQQTPSRSIQVIRPLLVNKMKSEIAVDSTNPQLPIETTPKFPPEQSSLTVQASTNQKEEPLSNNSSLKPSSTLLETKPTKLTLNLTKKPQAAFAKPTLQQSFPTETVSPNDLFFNVFFTKDLKKKKKQFDDGILAMFNSKIKLFNSEGTLLYQTGRAHNMKEPTQGSEYYIGSYMIEIQDRIKPEDFTSGRCFMKASVVITLGTTNSSNISKGLMKNQKTNIHENSNSQKEVVVPEDAYILLDREGLKPVYIDTVLSKVMRPHQKEGVKFMFECISGLRAPDISGCILADSMGLGKTLQTIALIYTLVKQNPYSSSKPLIGKAIIVAPLSMVGGWEKEIMKWLGSLRLAPIVAMGKGEQSFSQFKCPRKIILTGTPLQNSLEELFSCCDFVNPGKFYSYQTFRKVFSAPIIEGLRKDARPDQRELAQARSKELSYIISQFILRRPASILENLLPPKNEYFIFLKMHPLQYDMYTKILHSRMKKKNFFVDGTEAFSAILTLRKLLNHPLLVYQDEGDIATSVKGLCPSSFASIAKDAYSTKFAFVASVLERMPPKDKIIIVSYFVQTLDIVEEMCNEKSILSCKLDGSVAAQKRQSMFDRFNDRSSDLRVFLLCAKAGGTGLNLTGANRMILMEIDWNPSNDSQVMGRIWRDGQKKEVHIYRLLSTGTIEERMLQRQFVKENLSMNVVDEKNLKAAFDMTELKKVFEFHDDRTCLTFQSDENQKDDVVNSNEDFCAENAELITFIKKRIDIKHEKNAEGSEPEIKNEFGDENIFVSEKKSKQAEEGKDEEEDSKMVAESDEEKQEENGDDDEEGECFFEDEELSSKMQTTNEKGQTNPGFLSEQPQGMNAENPEKEDEESAGKATSNLSNFSSGEKKQLATKDNKQKASRDKENLDSNTEIKDSNVSSGNAKKITLNLTRLVPSLSDQEQKLKTTPEKEANGLKRPSQHDPGTHLLKMMKAAPPSD